MIDSYLVKRAMGRKPRKSLDAMRVQVIAVRCSEAEYEAIIKSAAAARAKPSTWLRQMGLSAAYHQGNWSDP